MEKQVKIKESAYEVLLRVYQEMEAYEVMSFRKFVRWTSNHGMFFYWFFDEDSFEMTDEHIDLWCEFLDQCDGEAWP
jgi:hypothetical protein